MIDRDKSGLDELLKGKTIRRVETIEHVLFKKDENGDRCADGGERFAIDKYVPEVINIEFTDGTNFVLRIRPERGYSHDGSGGANRFSYNAIPGLSVY